ncbi:MAG: excinuclease ABC subunit A [Deltaproteobacteria bacterium]|nr:excinuclease ABC subunit A [Deltaproteobacteria bacterium]
MAVRGAREHNLQDVDLVLPSERLIVITGLSGSGKSSLAFDTLYAEGQRRYVESLSAYARQFLDQMTKPDVDAIDGLSPAISIEQRGITRSPRSTVGTVTELSDHLRLLYARAGQPHCWSCDRPIRHQTVQEMTERVLALGEGARVELLAPVVRGRKGQYKKELARFAEQGFVRVRIDGSMHELGGDIALARQKPHDIEVVVDRVVARESARGRIADSIETALRLADGLVQVECGGQAELLSEANACIDCGVSFPELAPRLFSFNSPAGACEECGGLGSTAELDPDRIVPDRSRSLADGAIAPWGGRRIGRYYRRLLAGLAAHLEIDLDTPFEELPRKAQRAVLHGTGKAELPFRLRGRQTIHRRFDGVIGEVARRRDEGGLGPEELRKYTRPGPCPVCKGARVGKPARHIRLGGLAIHELQALSIAEAGEFLERLELGPSQRAVADRILREIRERLRFLVDVGVSYLTLDRASTTLSGGESQRIRLATQVGSHLLGVTYILDEPSIGLHPRDNQRLLQSLAKLRDAGNTVVVVEHDEATIRCADWVVDMGPGAGIHGGRVVAAGPPEAIAADPDSLTGAYLSGRRKIPVPPRRPVTGAPRLRITGCREHNLKAVDLALPLGRFSVVTGVSGSGKSTLVSDTLHRALARKLHRAEAHPGAHDELAGEEAIDKVIQIDQSPIGRTPRSNPMTYIGAFDGIRKMFSQVPEARVRGYGPGRFSFNVKGGRCESCQGDGLIRVEMHFLPDLFVTCEVCRGRRYNRETLEIRYKGHTIADLLEMSVEEALPLLENVPSLRRALGTLVNVGLGYVHLGQAATTLSGGEAQRIKLSRELAKRSTGRSLYLLDEPTTGLHFADVEKLLGVLHELVERGNTVVVVEHQLDVVKTADWVVDLGPEGGAEGGHIVAEGTPEQLATRAESHTGRALRSVLP